MELWIGALNLGLLYAFMTMGVFITFRIHDFPDITVDGSFTTGAAVTAVLMVAGINPLLALLAAFVLGAFAGSITAVIHTRLKINGLLAGILVMTGLYSINLHIMGRSNIPLLHKTSLFSYLASMNPGLHPEIWNCLALLLFMALFWLATSLFFKTDLGISMRITGNNATMAAASGINVDGMKVLGVSLANGLVGFSGGLVAQYQGFSDIGMGIGTIVIGLAAVIIGESVLKMRSMFVVVLSVILGSVVFRFMIAIALYVGMNPIDLKLLTAAFVLVTLIVSRKVGGGKVMGEGFGRSVIRLLRVRKTRFALAVVCLVAVAAIVYKTMAPEGDGTSKVHKIGLMQLVDHPILNITRDSLVKEMNRLGYQQGKNCTLMLENANGDLPTVNSILDKFLHENVDIVVTISTPCTQAAINKIKDRPVVFATVANPFIIGAGKSDTDHLPNVTGIYGWVPMDRTMEMVRAVLPGKLKVGSIWDPAHANSVFNVELLQKAVQTYEDVDFAGATVSSSSEVYQAALSLVNKGITAFVLSPDNIVYSAFESVVKAAAAKHLPIFISDVERLPDGALGALGYDYTNSGIQAARVLDRIMRGEKPKDIPFERYKKLTIGFNLKAAQELNIDIPSDLLEKATTIYGTAQVKAGSSTKDERPVKRPDKVVNRSIQPLQKTEVRPKRLALFLFSDNAVLMVTARGVTDELGRSGILKEHRIIVDMKNGQNEFYMSQSVAQDIVRQKYDYIITLSTPALQVMAQANKTIPHVFGAVTDPYRMGVAKNANDHLPNITGVATFQPVETTIEIMRKLFPNAGRIGIVWNPGEACSEACTLIARKASGKYQFELVEANVGSTGEVMDAVRSLISRGIDLFFTSGDNTVVMALESIADTLKNHKIPYFTNSPSDVERGAFVSIGADYYEVGVETARMATRVIRGENPKDIPIKDFVPEKMYVNQKLAGLYGITLSQAFLKQAKRVVK